MATRKIVNKHINESSSTYVGVDGELFYDTVTNTLKISDGTTPGGTTLTTDGGSAASITVVGDDSTGTAVNAGETIKIAGTQNITTAVSGDTLTITGPNLTGYAQKTDTAITIVSDDSTGTAVTVGETFKIAGGNNITTAVSGDTLTITGSKTIDVNEINSGDSSAIQINDAVNISGTLNAKTIVTNDLISQDSSAINVLDGMNVSGTLSADVLDVNELSSNDSTAIQINDSVNISGTLNAKTLIANTISSEDSSAIQINDGLRISGDLTFSNNTVQTTAYVTASGNWTVTTGTNTYSFTVPQEGTYTMWVKGNIANGIIIWNATVSVSNSNVAAIGYQYAWNYTGGGSPISLTAIPDQIRGTAGTISTDATYVGSTSNRFDFGISNTSGASQTIYYGYAKIS